MGLGPPVCVPCMLIMGGGNKPPESYYLCPGCGSTPDHKDSSSLWLMPKEQQEEINRSWDKHLAELEEELKQKAKKVK